MFLTNKQYIFCLAGLKRKRSQLPTTDIVASTRSVSRSGQLSANVSAPSTDSADSAGTVDSSKVGPAAKRARRTTLAGARQRDNGGSEKPEAAVLSVKAQETASKQSTEEDVRPPQSCEILINFIVLRPLARVK